jgi:ORF6N domain
MPKTRGNGPKRESMPLEAVGRHVYIFRGKRIMLDADVAALFRVPVYGLNQAVRRNRDRFPDDFMFQLTAAEAAALTAPFALANVGRGGRYTLPLAFTGPGVAMVSSVLKSDQAVRTNIAMVQCVVILEFPCSTP